MTKTDLGSTKEFGENRCLAPLQNNQAIAR